MPMNPVSICPSSSPVSEHPQFPSGSLSTPISLVSVCSPTFHLESVCPSLNPMCCLYRMAIAQHLPCLGVLLGVSGQRTGLYTSYRSTHRSTLSSQASDLSWISGRRRQASLGSESEVVRSPSPHWLAPRHPFFNQASLRPLGGASSETQGPLGTWDPGKKSPSPLFP